MTYEQNFKIFNEKIENYKGVIQLKKRISKAVTKFLMCYK